MKYKLEMDDIRVGMYITISRGDMEQRMVPGPHGPQVLLREKKHYNGKVLEVLSINMPFIAVAVHEARGTMQDNIDLRKVEIISLHPDYIHALLPNLEMKRESFWDEIEDTSLEESDTDIEQIFKDL